VCARPIRPGRSQAFPRSMTLDQPGSLPDCGRRTHLRRYGRPRRAPQDHPASSRTGRRQVRGLITTRSAGRAAAASRAAPGRGGQDCDEHGAARWARRHGLTQCVEPLIASDYGAAGNTVNGAIIRESLQVRSH